MNLPADTHLAYYVFHEAWYASVDPSRRPNVMICASAKGAGGGVAWEFEVSEYDLRGPTLRVEMFADSWTAFADLPELFTAMASGGISSLDELRNFLDTLGAEDETARSDPQRPTAGSVVSGS